MPECYPAPFCKREDATFTTDLRSMVLDAAYAMVRANRKEDRKIAEQRMWAYAKALQALYGHTTNVPEGITECLSSVNYRDALDAVVMHLGEDEARRLGMIA